MELKKNLKNGEHCPVCGSKEHFYFAHEVENVINSSDYESEIKSIKQAASIKEKIALFDKQIIENNERIKKGLELIQSEFSSVTEELLTNIQQNVDKGKFELKNTNETVDKLTEKIETFEKTFLELEAQKIQLENDRHETIKKYSVLSERVSNLEKQRDDLLSKSEEKLTLLEDKKMSFSIVNPLAEYEKIVSNAKEYDELTKELSSLTKSLDVVQEELKGVVDKINADNSEAIKLRQITDNVSGEIDKLRARIKVVVPMGKASDLKELATEKIDIIEREFASINKKFEDLSKILEEKNKQLKVTEGILSKFKKDLTELNTEYLQIYNKGGFGGESDHISFVLDEDRIIILERDVMEYDDLTKKYDTLIKQLSDKLGSAKVDADEMDVLLNEINEVSERIEESKKISAEIGVNLKQSRESYKKKIELEKIRIDIRKKVDVLELIQKMTKGQKFVEYVAMNQMKYILREASNRLKDITRNRYTLEMDSSSNFIICDNHNGGDKRDVNTLSGGETFVASLSLALALSSKIQLKGSASMEFFVLDEGFGTLDPDMLDVVMNSLEKLRTESIAVGVISHVDELKQRIPVKLEVSPAKSGIKGTTVTLIS
jgi:exonuclease SbcC